MGLAERGYYRDEPRGYGGGGGGRGPSGGFHFGRMNALSVTMWLIIVNIAVHLLANTALKPLYEWGHFSTYEGFQRLQVWRLVTFQFLHDPTSIMHLAFNMFGLWVFGGIVEETLGRRRYLAFYLVCGIFGGLMYLLLNLAGTLLPFQLPGFLFTDTKTPLIGASAGVFGVIMACAYIAPTMRLQFILLPISLTMRTVAYLYVGFAVLNLLLGGGNAGGDAAHVGGALAGAYFIRNSHLLLDFFDVLGDSRKQKAVGPRRKAAKPRGARGPKPGKPAKPSNAASRLAREEAEIDAILAKIQDEGIGSLSAREKKLLAKDTERKRRGLGGGGSRGGGRG
ncbi:MAG: rhomboid family intramembrane serine protease [Planctomycetota bacterium]|nr:rhomboid family intramembrane serine protease [Planctomycetota bacterium]